MSTPTPTAPPSGQQQVFRPGRIARGIAFFSGSVGYAIKLALLSASNALAVWAVYVLVSHHRWPALAVVVVATALIDFLYLVPRTWSLPAKFLIPGTIFLIGFQITPILYTINVAFTNYSTGHILTKGQAIRAIEINTLEQPENGRQFDMAVARDSSGTFVLLLRDPSSRTVYAGTTKGLTRLAPSAVTVGAAGPPTAARGYTLLRGAALFSLDQQLRTYKVPTAGGAAFEPQGTTTAVELKPSYRYDEKRNAFVRIKDGRLYRDNGRGSFVSASGEELLPGWKTYVGFRNFSTMIHDPLVRKPFLSVFAWTFVFAAARRLHLVRGRTLPRDHARQARPPVPEGPTARS